MKRNFLGWAVVALLLTACQTPAPIRSLDIQDLKNYGVTIKVTGGKLKASSAAQGWKSKGKKDGYVGWEKGQSGLVFFNLKNEDSGHVCGDSSKGKDAKWVITELYLSAFPEGPSADEKGQFGGEQPAWLKEAFPQVDLSNGKVFKTDKKDGVTFLSLANANEQVGEKFIYYQITAEECKEGGKKLTLDPGIRNGGK